MYIQTQNQYSKFTTDELSELLGQTTFQINNFGLWTSDHDNQASYISNDIEIVYYQKGGGPDKVRTCDLPVISRTL